MTIVLQFFPNGEFSQGVDTSKQRRDKHRKDEGFRPPLNKERRDAYLQWIKNYEESGYTQISKIPTGAKLVSSKHEYTLEERSTHRTVLSFQDTEEKKYSISLDKSLDCVMWEWGLIPLVHQTVESCENLESPTSTSSRKKLEGMTKNMARNIRNGVYLLEQQPGGKDCLSFLTLTLPDLSSKGLDNCCKNWDYMVKRFLDWLRIKVEKQDMNFMYVYATEIQTKRLEKRHEYAPHLHLVFRGRDGRKKAWVITPKQARKAWSACIASVVDECFNRNALENLQRVKKSAARYLSKYLSKGKCQIPQGASTDTIQALRTQWGGMAREVCRLIRHHKVRFDSGLGHSQICNAFLKSLPTLVNLGYVSYFKKGFISLHRCDATGDEYGLHVCGGVLSVSTYSGGLNPILDYIAHVCTFHDCL